MKKKLVSVLMCMAMGATLLAGCGSEEAADSRCSRRRYGSGQRSSGCF